MPSITSNLVYTEPDTSGSAQDKLILLTAGYIPKRSSFYLNPLILSKEIYAEMCFWVLMYICIT